MPEPASDALDRARQRTGLTPHQLWLRYFGLGGMRPELEVEAIMFGALEPTDLDRNRIVHALNERFSELGRNHPVPYAQSQGSPDGR
jgi:hypothetical protein